MAKPQIDKIRPSEDSLLLICDGLLSLQELEAQADGEDWLSVQEITAPARRRERLMWRRLLREQSGAPIEIEYAPSGRPIIKNFPYSHISVSHCRDVVAVVASQRVCGVDVERKGRDFERVASRYVSPQEWALCEESGCEREQFLCALWCAKECLYKMGLQQGLDMCHDLRVERIDLEQAIVVGRVKGGEPIAMRIIDREDYLVVYSC